MNRPIFSIVSTTLMVCLAAAGQTTNPAEIPTEQGDWATTRHGEKLNLEKEHQYDLLLVGDSITQNFEKSEYKPTWDEYFGSRNALDLGYSGARTENLLWNIDHGELDGQSPKVITLLVGTNNADETNYPTHHTPEQIYGGVRAIVERMRQKCPNSKILLIRCLPFGEHPGKNSRDIVLTNASKMERKLVDNRHVYWCDINRVFLNPDGSSNKELMPDYLHPSPKGAQAWCVAMEPQLSKLMGDKRR